MSALPDDVRGLLEAVRDALDVPLPDITPADERAHAALLERRASRTRIAVASVLDGHNPDDCAANLRRWIDDDPITYTPWKSEDRAPAARCEPCGCHPDAPDYVTDTCPCTCHGGEAT